jgi:hypothetical protein
MLLIVIHFFTVAGRASTFSTELVASLEFTHSHHHEHNDEHQHEHGDIEADANIVHPSLPTEEHTHRHEIVVSGQILYIQSDCYTSFFNIRNLVLYPKFDQAPPQAPFLYGIFRPPIYA